MFHNFWNESANLNAFRDNSWEVVDNVSITLSTSRNLLYYPQRISFTDAVVDWKKSFVTRLTVSIPQNWIRSYKLRTPFKINVRRHISKHVDPRYYALPKKAIVGFETRRRREDSTQRSYWWNTQKTQLYVHFHTPTYMYRHVSKHPLQQKNDILYRSCIL